MVDVLVLIILGGAVYNGYRRGFALASCFGVAFVVAGLLASAAAVAIGTPPPALAFVIGGLLAMIPPARKLDAIRDHVHGVIPDRLQFVDRLLGGGAAAATVFAIGWFVAAVVVVVPGDSGPLRAVRASALLSSATDALPPAGPLGAVVLRSGLVPGLNGPLVLAEEPDASAVDAPAVVAARRSVVQVRGIACSQLSTGTAWMAAPGLLLTNAHVVAGQRNTYVALGPRERGVPATVTAFDPVNDIAALVLEGATLQPLPLATTFRHGQSAAVIGFPKGGEQFVVPARLDRVAAYDVEPLGGGAPVGAQVLGFRAAVQPGNSGGPIIGLDGAVVGIVVASAIGQRIDAGYGAPIEAVRGAIAAGSRRQPVPTGACLGADDLAPGREPVAPEIDAGGREIPDELAAEPLVEPEPGA